MFVEGSVLCISFNLETQNESIQSCETKLGSHFMLSNTDWIQQSFAILAKMESE